LSFSRIFVLGAGAIGSVYGACLSESYDVTLIGNRNHVKAIKANGLSIVGDMRKVFHIKADTQIRGILGKTLVILTTKAYDSARAMEGVRSLLKKDTVILVLQNGLGNEGTVKRIVGDRAKILRGITKMAAEFLRPGKIRFWSGETIIESNEDAGKISEILNECRLKSRLSEHIDQEVWTKLVVNCVVNPLTALFRVKNCAIWADSLRTVRQSIITECVEVAEAEGILLPADLAERMDKRLSCYTNFSSMYQDIVKHKRTEIDFLNGKIVELGRKHHIKTPVNETLLSFIKFLEGENGISREN